MDIKLDMPNLNEVVSAAILSNLDTVKREALIKSAIEHLLSPTANRGYGAKSPLEDAFHYACRDVAMKIAAEMLTDNSAFIDQVRTLVTEAITRIMETNREATITKVGDAIAAGMAYRDR